MSQAVSPFKFLDSYQEKDRDIFFGRERETETLYDALSGVKHLLVYGPSGAGKTSLVECGLRNQFSDADWFALTIRRGTNMTASVFAGINNALRTKLDLDDHQLPLDKAMGFGQVIEVLFAERYQPIYLLFDQFEELLISGTEDEKREFFFRLNQLIRYKVPCRTMLIMREEFIGHLSEFEPLCPSIFQHRFRLEKMRRGDVRAVIQKTLEAPQYISAFKVNQSELLTDEILSKLPDERREIELAHVQVFLAELFDRADEARKDNALPVLDQNLIEEEDNLEGVLDKFLKKQLQELDHDFGKDKAMEVLSLLISERHTKLQATEEELAKELENKSVALDKTLPQLLESFLQRRILRTLKAGEKTQYEISHDVLALVVGRNLTDAMKQREKAASAYRHYLGLGRIFVQEELDDLRPHAKYLTFPPTLAVRMKESEAILASKQQEELVKTRRRLQMVIGLLVGAVIALFAAVYFGINSQRQTREAENAKVVAENAKSIAELAKVESDSLRRISEVRLHAFEEAERMRLMVTVNGLVAKAESFKRSGEPRIALETLEGALKLDSSRVDIRNKIAEWR